MDVVTNSLSPERWKGKLTIAICVNLQRRLPAFLPAHLATLVTNTSAFPRYPQTITPSRRRDPLPDQKLPLA
jgi:hypothetical protein